MALNASGSSFENNATRLMSCMARGLRLLNHHIVRVDLTLAEPGGPAELSRATDANAGNLHIPQQQPHLPGPFVVRVEAHQRVQLRQPARPGQEIAERRERERADHDFELVLA